MKKITQYISGENAQAVITKGMKSRGVSQKELSSAMGEIPQSLNQQLRRQQDMKVRRFVEVMEYLGFEVMIVEREFRRVTPKAAREIIKEGSPRGLFWARENGLFIGIDSTGSEVSRMEFTNAKEMRKWFENRPGMDADGDETG